ncbi:MAG TPA: YbaK/EbsC family protein [Anaerolineae bacterium]|nr:YbaK/EbsC family protein [Anaerolineae bacterium]MCB0213993.1 YbaK/EbsC family protein [Anaerolineae bacterium]MCB9108943.1 YbaK/EbsC family protein [Anaerolineales bacterium]HRV92753.1 YbaK/EbsC family protein [Anaerolineae bacterium]
MHSTAQKVANAAQQLGLTIEIKEFEASTRTAQEAADAIGCSVGQIVKSLLFVVDEQPVMALVSGANQLDEKKLAALCSVGRKKVKRGNADITREATGFAIGGVPPFGHARQLPTYIDEDFARFEIIWAAAGTPNAVFAITLANLVQTTQGTIASLKDERSR